MSSVRPPPDSICNAEAIPSRTVSAQTLLRLRHHATYLLIALAVLVLGSVLRIDDQNRVVVPGIELALPAVCVSLQWLGMSCPGCGLTRGCIALMHGRWQEAWTYNPGIFLVLLLVVLQFPYRVVQMRRVLSGVPELQYSGVFENLLMGTILLLFVQWIIGMCT